MSNAINLDDIIIGRVSEKLGELNKTASAGKIDPATLSNAGKAVLAKVAGKLPPQFMKNKDEGKDDDKDEEKDKDEDDDKDKKKGDKPDFAAKMAAAIFG